MTKETEFTASLVHMLASYSWCDSSSLMHQKSNGFILFFHFVDSRYTGSKSDACYIEKVGKMNEMKCKKSERHLILCCLKKRRKSLDVLFFNQRADLPISRKGLITEHNYRYNCEKLWYNLVFNILSTLWSMVCTLWHKIHDSQQFAPTTHNFKKYQKVKTQWTQ